MKIQRIIRVYKQYTCEVAVCGVPGDSNAPRNSPACGVAYCEFDFVLLGEFSAKTTTSMTAAETKTRTTLDWEGRATVT